MSNIWSLSYSANHSFLLSTCFLENAKIIDLSALLSQLKLIRCLSKLLKYSFASSDVDVPKPL